MALQKKWQQWTSLNIKSNMGLIFMTWAITFILMITPKVTFEIWRHSALLQESTNTNNYCRPQEMHKSAIHYYWAGIQWRWKPGSQSEKCDCCVSTDRRIIYVHLSVLSTFSFLVGTKQKTEKLVSKERTGQSDMSIIVTVRVTTFLIMILY